MADSASVWHEIQTAPQLGVVNEGKDTRQLAQQVAPLAGHAERYGGGSQLSLLGQLLYGAAQNDSIRDLAGQLTSMSVDMRFGEALGILGPNKELAAIDFVGGGPNIVRCASANNWACEVVPKPKEAM